MIRIIRIGFAGLFVVPTFILSLIPFWCILFLRLIKCQKAADKLTEKSFKRILYLCAFFIGAKVHVIGEEKIPPIGEKICYFANHQSMIDICLPTYAKNRMASYIAKVEIKKIPIVSNWLVLTHGVFLDRKNPRESIKAMITGSANVKNHIPMIIFPEGTRSKDAQVHTFKAGSFKLATRAGAYVQPVAIANARKVAEGATSLLRQDVYVKYLDPIDTSVLTEEEILELPKKVEDLIRAEVDYYQNAKTK